MKIAFIFGTRPEIIKMSPIIRAAESAGADFYILHTNQHYSANMDKIFLEELNLPTAKYNLNIGSGSHGSQTGRMLEGIEGVFSSDRPDVVLVQGDTNTVLAGALAAAKMGIKIGHVEAGLRSYDRTMPEEINRIMVDHIADYLFPPTKSAAKILIHEGIDNKKVFTTGNTIVDAVSQNLSLAKGKSKVLNRLRLKEKSYFLLTMHRPANVDDRTVLSQIINALGDLIATYDLPIIFPIHPRTQKQLETFKLTLPARLVLCEPVGYLDFLTLEANARLILTDSGGIQEEACILHVPCVTLRENTERPETIEVGANLLGGIKPATIKRAVSEMLVKNVSWKNPFGKGDAGKQIFDRITKDR